MPLILKEPFGSAVLSLAKWLRVNSVNEESQILHLHFVPVQNDRSVRQ